MTPEQMIQCAEEIKRRYPKAVIVPDHWDTKLGITDGEYRYYGLLDVCEGTIAWEHEE